MQTFGKGLKFIAVVSLSLTLHGCGFEDVSTVRVSKDMKAPEGSDWAVFEVGTGTCTFKNKHAGMTVTFKQVEHENSDKKKAASNVFLRLASGGDVARDFFLTKLTCRDESEPGVSNLTMKFRSCDEALVSISGSTTFERPCNYCKVSSEGGMMDSITPFVVDVTKTKKKGFEATIRNCSNIPLRHVPKTLSLTEKFSETVCDPDEKEKEEFFKVVGSVCHGALADGKFFAN